MIIFTSPYVCYTSVKFLFNDIPTSLHTLGVPATSSTLQFPAHTFFPVPKAGTPPQTLPRPGQAPLHVPSQRPMGALRAASFPLLLLHLCVHTWDPLNFLRSRTVSSLCCVPRDYIYTASAQYPSVQWMEGLKQSPAIGSQKKIKGKGLCMEAWHIRSRSAVLHFVGVGTGTDESKRSLKGSWTFLLSMDKINYSMTLRLPTRMQT